MRYVVLALSIHLVATQLTAEPMPARGITGIGKVVKVYDGDTFFMQPLPPITSVRMLDCWAPEIRRGKKATDASIVKGFQSKHHLQTLLPEGSLVTYRIDTHGKLDKSFTFGRILAKVWNKDKVDVCEEQVRSGHATVTRSE